MGTEDEVFVWVSATRDAHPSTFLRNASECAWIIPRPKKHATGIFFPAVQLPVSSNPYPNGKQKKTTPNGVVFFCLAEDEGFEPPQTESESGVLPLHKSSIAGTFVIIRTFSKKSRSFFKNFKISCGIIFTRKKVLYSSQGKGFPASTCSFRYRKVTFSPSSRSMARR